MSVDVLTFGEALAAFRTGSMLSLGGPLQLSVAGAESNVAIGLARLGHRARWVGRVGADPFGSLVLRTLRAEAVDVAHVREVPHEETGIGFFETAPGGARRVHYRRASSAARQLSPEDVTSALTSDARILHVTGITAALGPLPLSAVAAAVEAAHANGTQVSLDVNFRSALWGRSAAAEALRPLIPTVGILIASEDELSLTSAAPDEEAQARDLLRLGVREVVVKRGDRGATVHTADGCFSAPALRVRVVDPIGAGDAFTAGYLSAWLDGVSVDDRLRRAVTMGAAAVASPGDWESLPTREELAFVSIGEVQR